MTRAHKIQIGLIAAALILFVLLFLAPQKQSGELPEQDAAKYTDAHSASIESFLTTVLKSMKVVDKNSYDTLYAKASASKTDTAFAVLVRFWDKQKRPDFAAYFTEKIAKQQQTSESYRKAGDRYYYSVAFTNDNNEMPLLYQSAMRCYEKALEKNHLDLDAKIQLAACYVEGSNEPMKGISLLKEVEKTDSNNVKLQLSFAFFSIKSQQWDKAIKRFETVLKLDPLYIEAYLHLADAYEQQGQTQKTIEMLKKYADVTEDATAKQEVLKYIEQLKK